MNHCLRAWLWLLLPLLSGCMPSEIVSETERYLGDAALIDNVHSNRGPNFVLYPDSRLLVAAPSPGGGYPELEGWLVVQTAVALRSYFPEVAQSSERLGLSAALTQGRREGADFLVLVEPLYAEDQYGHWDEWEDLPLDLYDTGRDRVELRFRLYSLADRRLIGTWQYLARSGLLTFVDDIPEDLTEPAAVSFARRLSAYPK